MPNNNDNNDNGEVRYLCTECGAAIPTREDGFLQTVCMGCGGVGFVRESIYAELWEKPVVSPPRPHTGRIEAYAVDSGAAFKFVGELRDEWVRSDTAVNLGDAV